MVVNPRPQGSVLPAGGRFQGKRAAMVTFSPHPADPRPRRAAEALVKEGMSVDLICLADGAAPDREALNGINVLRLPIKHRRGGAFSYAYSYSAFILISASILAARALRRRYDLVYVHNMPDVLVVSSLVPKTLGAKVLLDLHDPMPELMRTIFRLEEGSLSVRLMERLERWSMGRADLAVTVNLACKRIFASRSCDPEKIHVVMNTPDERIFPFRPPRSSPAPDRISNRRLVVMYHGSLVERNGLDLALQAVAQLREAVPGIELRIYGARTPFLEKVMREAANGGLKQRVHYLGARRLEDLVREIEDCDVGIIPNHRSAFTEINTPTRIFEYLALAKPVIAPRTPGIQDYFGPDSILFFEPGNSEELAGKIEYVALHYGEALKSAERGQRVYLAHTWDREKATLVHVVNKLLNGSGPYDLSSPF